MKDTSFGTWLIVLFGGVGLITVALGWLLPWLETERITATLAGGAGLMIAGAQALILRRRPAKKRAPVEIDFDVQA